LPIGRRGLPSVRKLAFPVHDATTTRRAGSLTPIDAVSDCSDRQFLIGLMRIKLSTKLRSTPVKRHARTYIEIMAKAPVVRHRSRRAICRGRKACHLSCVYFHRVKTFEFCFSVSTDIGDRALHDTGLRSAVTGKGKHRGTHLLYVTLIRLCPARGRVLSLAMRYLCCCLAEGMTSLCECDLAAYLRCTST
jgi:hypothetical protein